MTSIIESVSLLTPYDIDLPKQRIGPNTDGGYIFAGDLEPSQTVLSYGISTEFRFDEEMARRGHIVHMFDHTIEPLSPPHPNMIFHSEGVAGVSQSERRLYAVADHLRKYDVVGDDLILKMDVEGAEYQAFLHMDRSTLLRFSQIVVEVHNIHLVADATFKSTFDSVFSKLNEHFTLFHVHANNSNSENLHLVNGVPVAALLEMSYIRSNLVKRSVNATVYPTVLDFPCVDKRENMLLFYPFLPTFTSTADVRRSEVRTEYLHSCIENLKADPHRDFDVRFYRLRYPDLAALSDDGLKDHFHRHGIQEGRLGSAAEVARFEHSLVQ